MLSGRRVIRVNHFLDRVQPLRHQLIEVILDENAHEASLSFLRGIDLVCTRFLAHVKVLDQLGNFTKHLETQFDQILFDDTEDLVLLFPIIADDLGLVIDHLLAQGTSS